MLRTALYMGADESSSSDFASILLQQVIRESDDRAVAAGFRIRLALLYAAEGRVDRVADELIAALHTGSDKLEAEAEKLLIGATGISFFDLVPMALEAGALCIPAHIDREYFGVLAHLGFLPDLPYSAVEVAAPQLPEAAGDWPVVRFSDAHQLDQIGRRYTEVEVAEFTVPALRRAFEEQLIQENRL